MLRLSICLGNLQHESAEAASLMSALGLQWPDESMWQAAPNEPEVENNKQTIREIKAMCTSA